MRRTPARPNAIRIVPIGPVEGEVLVMLERELPQRFAAPVRRGPPLELRDAWYDAVRRQYRGDEILDALVARRGAPDLWTLGVVAADLYVPGLNFIFGQATVAGCCGVIALARLRPEFHGEAPDPARYHRRALVEAVHELGHVWGREHCGDPACVMHFSNTVEDTDRKGPEFCRRCGR